MKLQMKIKIGLDVLMTGLLLALMVYQITGQVLHEWFGASMCVLFLAHNVLNAGWYKGLFWGKYTVLRAVQTAVNFSILVIMLCLGYSGMVMSRHVFAVLPVNGPMATARIMHLAASGDALGHDPGDAAETVEKKGGRRKNRVCPKRDSRFPRIGVAAASCSGCRRRIWGVLFL